MQIDLLHFDKIFQKKAFRQYIDHHTGRKASELRCIDAHWTERPQTSANQKVQIACQISDKTMLLFAFNKICDLNAEREIVLVLISVDSQDDITKV